MSRVAKKPIALPKGVEVTLKGQEFSVKGAKGSLNYTIHQNVDVQVDAGIVNISPKDSQKETNAIAGTTRALLQNMVTGVSEGFVRKLELVGVGYRAQAQGKAVNLSLGYSHPVVYQLPEGVTAETPSQTEILLKGTNKQVIGQVAAEIRAFRPPEPYKGKGIKYANEVIVRKEAKKK